MRKQHLGVLAVLAGSSTALATDVNGSVRWTDGVGGTHAARRVKVAIIEEHPMLGSVLAGVVDTDLDGNYAASVSFRPGYTGYAAIVIAQNDAGFVSSDGTDAGKYAVWGGFRGTVEAAHIDTVISNASSAEQAFGIADAMYTGWRFGVSGRAGDAPPAPVPAMYPAPLMPGLGTVPYWDGTKLNIIAGGQYDWDTAMHEYTHYLSSIDPLDNSPGGAHTFTVSNIPARGKHNGTRLAWGEGLADWGGVAAQRFDPVGGHTPAGVPNVGDTSYDDTNQGFSIDLEHRAGSGAWGANNSGEGDEVSVMRILWDIGDPANEPFDRVALGHDVLYRQLRAISIGEPLPVPHSRGVECLHDVWDHFTGGTTTYSNIADFGAIFEEYGVSPHPTDDFVATPIVITDPAPTFHWLRQNDGENDTFAINFYTSDLGSLLLHVDVPGDVEFFTLTPADWATLSALPLGDYRYVVIGGDAINKVTGMAYAPADQSLGYWSDSYLMTLVPAPGVLGFSPLVAFLGRRRRRE